MHLLARGSIFDANGNWAALGAVMSARYFSTLLLELPKSVLGPALYPLSAWPNLKSIIKD
jgi:hypothetical protein